MIRVWAGYVLISFHRQVLIVSVGYAKGRRLNPTWEALIPVPGPLA
jgi:hypothetical protein